MIYLLHTWWPTYHNIIEMRHTCFGGSPLYDFICCIPGGQQATIGMRQFFLGGSALEEFFLPHPVDRSLKVYTNWRGDARWRLKTVTQDPLLYYPAVEPGSISRS